MTDRWHTSLSSELNKRIAIYREVDGTKVRYDVRGSTDAAPLPLPSRHALAFQPSRG